MSGLYVNHSGVSRLCSWCGASLLPQISPSVARGEPSLGLTPHFLHFGCFDAWGKEGGSKTSLQARAAAFGLYGSEGQE